FSPDGRTLAAGVQTGAIRFWDTATWEERASLPVHNRGVQALAFSPDGRFLASGGVDSIVAVGPDGRTLGSGEERTVTLVDAATNQVKYVFRNVGTVVDLAFSPDGRTLAAICSAKHPPVRLSAPPTTQSPPP